MGNYNKKKRKNLTSLVRARCVHLRGSTKVESTTVLLSQKPVASSAIFVWERAGEGGCGPANLGPKTKPQ